MDIVSSTGLLNSIKFNLKAVNILIILKKLKLYDKIKIKK